MQVKQADIMRWLKLLAMSHSNITGILLLLVWSLSPDLLTAQSQYERDLQVQQQELNRKIDQSNQYLQSLQKTQDASLKELQVIRQTIEDRQRLVALLEEEMTILKADADHISAELDSINAIKDQLNSEYYAIVAANYKRQRLISPLHMMLSAHSINRLLSQNVLAEQYHTHIEAKKAEYDQVEKVSNALYKSYQAAISQNAKQQITVNQEKESIDAQLVLQEQLLAELNAKEETIRADLAESRRYRGNVNQRIELFIQKTIDQTHTVQSSHSLPPASVTPPTKSLIELKGNLPRPISGTVVSKFGRQRHPSLQDVYVVNNGIDIGTSQPQTVKSIGSGKIVKVEQIKNGNLVLIQSDGVYHLYSPVINTQVVEGQVVSQGQSIGTVNEVLHLEIWEGKRKVDPQSWLR